MTRILIADSDAAFRKALSLLLNRRFGMMEVEEAADVESLIRDLSECPYDLLLLDWRILGAPAPETCRLLLKAFPELKIVLLSVNAEDIHAAHQAGAGFIHKGASPNNLLSVITPLIN